MPKTAPTPQTRARERVNAQPTYEQALTSFYRQAQNKAARIVTTFGTKSSTSAFIDDPDVIEQAEQLATDMLGKGGMSIEEHDRINDIITPKLTEAEWVLYNKAECAQYGHAVACLEAGILIGIEWQRARSRKGSR